MKLVAQTSTTAVALTTDAPKASSSKGKRAAQMAGAAALSFGLMGTFALPAYATEPAGDASLIDGYSAPAQSLQTADVDVESVAPLAIEGVEDAAILAAEAKQAEEAEKAKQAEEAAKASATGAKSFSGVDIPAGAGAQGIVSAALAQIGVMQDCTALVENSLRAIGIPAGDLGTQIGEYTGLGGTLVSSGDYAPGDVLIWSGRHVAVYIGNGQAVHGGYGGNQTVIAGAYIDGHPSAIVRF